MSYARLVYAALATTMTTAMGPQVTVTHDDSTAMNAKLGEVVQGNQWDNYLSRSVVEKCEMVTFIIHNL